MSVKASAHITFITVIHKNAYEQLKTKLETNLPGLNIVYGKSVGKDYYVLGLENDDTNYSLKDIFDLPCLCFREEYSKILLFKNMNSYNSCLKNFTTLSKNCLYELVKYLISPYEILDMCGGWDCESIQFTYLNSEHQSITKKITNITDLFGDNNIQSLFSSHYLKINDKDFNLLDKVKDYEWKVAVKRND